jgi:hypothetical protein
LRTVVAGGAQSREIKYLEVFERLPQGVRAGVLLRLEVAKRKLRRVNVVESVQRRMKIELLQRERGLSSAGKGRTLVHFTEVVKEQ